MAGTKLPFTQAAVTRAIKGAERAGVPVDCVEVAPDGRIILRLAGPPRPAPGAVNEWDEVLAR